MKRLFSVFTLLLAPSLTFAQDGDPIQSMVSTTPVLEQSPARLKKAKAMQQTEASSPDVVVIGDSIAERWGPFATRDFPGRQVLNLGIGGERTQELLWRADFIDIGKVRPKSVVLIIGTNNFTDRTMNPYGVVAGVNAVVAKLSSTWPGVPIHLLQILPRGKDFGFRGDDREKINTMLAKAYSRDKNVAYVAVDEAKITCSWKSDGCNTFVKDLLHPSGDGYVLMRQALSQASQQKFGRDLLQ